MSPGFIKHERIKELRKLFPVTDHMVYLNNAAESPLNRLVETRLVEYLKLAARTPHKKPFPRRSLQPLLAQLLGGNADEYALVTSTGLGIGMVAAGFNWQAGDNVVLPADEHWNNTFPWLALKKKGVDVRLIPMDGDFRVPIERIAEAVDAKTRILAIAAVRHNTGFRADLKELSQLAHNHGALFVVDGIQAAGVVPLNVEEDGIDVLASAGFKWLLGMPGTGFLYVSKGAMDQINPVLPGMFAAEDNLRELCFYPDARAYETGTLAYSLFHAWTAALELLLDIGIDSIHKQVIALTDHLIEGLNSSGINVLSPVKELNERSAIVTFTTGSAEKNQLLIEQLKERNILIALRHGICRISPNFFNTFDEIDTFLSTIHGL